MEICKDDKEVFIITWKIRNFSFGWKDNTYTILSPVFEIQTSETSSWRLDISPSVGTNWIHYIIRTFSKSLPIVGYEISFLAQDGSSIISTQVSKFDFSSEEAQYHSIFMRNKTILLQQDVLTVRMKMWAVEGSSLVGEHVFAETKLEVEKGSSFWYVDKFSYLRRGDTRALLFRSSLTDSLSISFNICQEEDECLRIKVHEVNSQSVKHCKCTFFLLDSAGEKTECGKLDMVTTDRATKADWNFPLAMKKSDLLKEKTRFLPNDILLFQCDFIYCTGTTSKKIIDAEIDDVSDFPEKNSEKLKTLRADLKSLYIDPILCDTKLQTATESVPAHSAILSARSPVFRAMFTIDMKEKAKECVCIEDLDADTVRRMLLFMYSDVFENVDWESAKSLYIASDKYDIPYLKQLCASFLKDNLLPTNCCDALLLGYMHQDSKLMDSARDFMSEHTKEVLTSEKWEMVEKENPLLTSETLRLLFLKKLDT